MNGVRMKGMECDIQEDNTTTTRLSLSLLSLSTFFYYGNRKLFCIIIFSDHMLESQAAFVKNDRAETGLFLKSFF